MIFNIFESKQPSTQKIWPEIFKTYLGIDCLETFIEIPKILKL